MSIRCRIAPSPSGFLHIGTAKMALFNWLFARKMNGVFVLRLEDTDAERSDEAFVQAMCEGFRWLGIDWDEGPEFGGEPARGDFGPYRQSNRRDRHVAAAERMLDAGRAYKCFLTKDELDAMREQARAEKSTTAFRSPWRDKAPEEAEAMGDAPYVLRFKTPEGETVVHDLVQGDVRTNHAQIDDFVILKPNGDPIFHLAVVVDDAEMHITHVVRGDDHLTNAARHVLLFEALGFDLPKFAHLPMVLDERGKKFSKREHGANVLDWREDGFLAEALVNYVALLGWTPAEENRELFTREELMAAFVPERWGKSAAKFDRKKLEWLNGQHIRKLSTEALRGHLLPRLHAAGFDLEAKSEAWVDTLIELCREKLQTLNDIVDLCAFLFQPVAEYDGKAAKKQWGRDDAVERLQAMSQSFSACAAWNAQTLHDAIDTLAAAREEGFGKWGPTLRLATTGKASGPDLFPVLELLGRDETLKRLDAAMAHIGNNPNES